MCSGLFILRLHSRDAVRQYHNVKFQFPIQRMMKFKEGLEQRM